MTAQIMKNLFRCSICKSQSFEKIYESGMFSSKTNVVICRECGLLCLNPRWSEESYNEYYKNNYYSGYMDVSSAIDKPYLIRDDSRSGQIYESIINFVAKGDPVLEIGAGNGNNSVYLCQNGFTDVSCVEIDSTCCQRISNCYPNIKVHCSSLAEFAKNVKNRQHDNYRMIILSHVAEHFVQPEQSLRLIHDLLDENGYLLITVPNIFAAQRPYRYFTTPHTHYFSDVTLKSILGLSGLKVTAEASHQQDEIAIIAQKSSEREPIIDADEFKRARNLLMSKYYWDDLFRPKIRRVIEHIMSEKVIKLMHKAVSRFRRLF